MQKVSKKVAVFALGVGMVVGVFIAAPLMKSGAAAVEQEKLTTGDALVAYQGALGLVELTPEQLERYADVLSDIRQDETPQVMMASEDEDEHQLTTGDALLLFRYALGLDPLQGGEPMPTPSPEPTPPVAPTLCPELALQMTIDWWKHLGGHGNEPIRALVSHYYGSYNEWEIVNMEFIAKDVNHYVLIAGYLFMYPSSAEAYAYKDSKFYSLQRAYDVGLLTKVDILGIRQLVNPCF